jgi:MFS family permease
MAPAVTAPLLGVEGLGELFGALFTGFGVACLIGPPLAGALVDYTLDHKWAVVVAASASVLALIFVFPLPRSP